MGVVEEYLAPAWPCWIEVDLDAIRHNVEAIRDLLPEGCEIAAVVKAQGYGHGAIPVARVALDAGASWLAVARVREGLQLREAGLDAPILLLGPFGDDEIPSIVDHRLRPTVVHPRQAEKLSSAAEAAGRLLPVHLKVDTGISRYGVSLEELRALLPHLLRLPGLRIEALYSHFATADDPDLAFARTQLETFQRAREALETDGFRFPLVHMAASGGTLAVGDARLGMVRLGLSLYGLYPATHLSSRVALKPALSFHSRVVRAFSLRAGQSVGYGRTFVASGPITAALVPVGYADGLPRSHSNRGFVLIRGRRARIIGRVSMDQCVADVTASGAGEGEPAVLIGAQGGDCISCEEFAATSGTVNYEVITSLGYRVPRVYRRGGRVVGVAHLDEGKLEGEIS